MRYSCFLLIFAIAKCSLASEFESSSSTPLVSLELGKLRGTKQTVADKDVNVFLGIPFAQPPVDALRFKKPIPVTKKWNDVLEAKTWPKACMQVPLMRKLLAATSEDCLYLNVWTPTDLDSDFSKNLKPVMVWIHGGAFIFGSSSREVYNASLMSALHDVIVVTINYRLGAFGFLSAANDEIPGNMGLYDQALALEWVQENIAYFGGDKSLVTIYGLSAGGMSVTQHLTSPISQSLYKNAIIASGVSVDYFTVDSTDVALKKAKVFAKLVGCQANVEDSEPMSQSTVECLRKIDANKLLQHQFSDEIPRVSNSLVRISFLPVFGEAFNPKLNQEMWKNKVFKRNSNLLIGTLPNDAMAIVKLKSNDVNLNNRIDVVFNDLITKFMPHESLLNLDDVLKLYTSYIDISDTHQSKKALYTALNDMLFVCPSLVFAEEYSLMNDVYYYVFNYDSSDDSIDVNKICDTIKPCHAIDEYFAFGSVTKEDDTVASRQWMSVIAHFVKTGTVPWPKYEKSSDEQLIPFYYQFNGDNSSSFVDVGFRSCICNLFKRHLFKKLY